MLNLNLNLIGTQKQQFKAANQYQIRPDAYSQYIVVAIPGALFKNGLDQNQFGMSQPWDDISAYVRGGGVASGSNLDIYVTASANPASSSIYATSSYVKWDNPQDLYPSSLYFNGANALAVNKTWSAKEGGNLTFDKSFVIETWAGFAETSSVGPGPSFNYTPNRIFAWKYAPSDNTTSAYLWNGIWGGEGISGSTQFVYDTNNGGSYSEAAIEGTGSFATYPNYSWRHYAVSYQQSPARRLNIYINGYLQNSKIIEAGADINQYTSEILQIMGTVDNAIGEGAYSGSQVVMQDFRMYNGTYKNYNGPSFTTPQSIVTWG